MKRTIIVFVAAVLAISATAMAGVILDQEVTSNGPMGASTSKRTLEIQDHKQKVINGNHSVITDLDNGVMILLDPSAKTYTEMPFPPPQLTMQQHAGAFKISFKKTGKHKTEQGYRCDEYVGAGHMMMGDYTVTGCFSKSAPGAADYTAFDKALESKLKGTPMETEGPRPEGVPLVLNSKTKLDTSLMPGLSPERAKAIASHPNMNVQHPHRQRQGGQSSRRHLQRAGRLHQARAAKAGDACRPSAGRPARSSTKSSRIALSRPDLATGPSPAPSSVPSPCPRRGLRRGS